MPTSERYIETLRHIADHLLAAFKDAGGTDLEAVVLGVELERMRLILGFLRGTHEIRPKFPAWRTVRRGVYKTLDAYLAAMKAKGYRVGTYAGQILAKVVWAQEETEEEIVRVLDKDLGLADPYTLDEILAAAAQFGLYRLAADVAAGLREQYDDQPAGESCLVAMDPIAGSGRDVEVFSVGRSGGGVWLFTYYADPKFRFGLGNVWILSRRKPASTT